MGAALLAVQVPALVGGAVAEAGRRAVLQQVSPSPSPSPTATPSPTGAQLVLDVSSDQDSVRVGERIGFVLAVRNNGDSAAQEVRVTASVPPELKVLSVGSAGGRATPSVSRSGSRETVTWFISSLAEGEALQLDWTGEAVKEGDGLAESRAEAAAENAPAVRDEVIVGVLPARGGGAGVPPKSGTNVSGAETGQRGNQSNGLPMTGPETWVATYVAIALIALGSLLVQMGRTPVAYAAARSSIPGSALIRGRGAGAYPSAVSAAHRWVDLQQAARARGVGTGVVLNWCREGLVAHRMVLEAGTYRMVVPEDLFRRPPSSARAVWVPRPPAAPLRPGVPAPPPLRVAGRPQAQTPPPPPEAKY